MAALAGGPVGPAPTKWAGDPTVHGVWVDRPRAGTRMKHKLDAARLKLSTVTPQTPEREINQMIAQLALTCSIDELGWTD